MGRPRKHTDDEVLDRALELFWRRGYAGTSVQDLVDATGLGRASLYGAFGDKEQLFEKVLARYGERMAPAGRALALAPTVREGLRRFFEAWLASACGGGSGARGCLLLQAANETEPRPPAVERALRESMLASERTFLQALRRGKRTGELDKGLDALGMARYLVVLVQGVAASARAGRSRAELKAAIERGLSLLDRR